MKYILKCLLRHLTKLKLNIKYRNKKSRVSSAAVSGDIVLGKGVVIGKRSIIGPRVKIGDYSYLNTQFGQSYIDSDVTIGKYCSIAPNVCIALGNHAISFVTTSPILYDKKRGFVKSGKENKGNEKNTIIGNDVWIGANANVKKGVYIGNGAIVAMNSVVTKNVPDYAVVAGNPARVIKYRFDSDTIEKLLKSEWWNWPEDVIKAKIDLFFDAGDFCAIHNNSSNTKK